MCTESNIVRTLTMSNVRRQYYIANKIIVVAFYLIKVFGLWPYHLQLSVLQTNTSVSSIIYSIFASTLILCVYAYISSDIYANGPIKPSSKVFASVPLQLIVILYSYLLIISYIILYVGQLVQYSRKKNAYLKCKKIAEFMKEYRTEGVDIQHFLKKFLLKTLVFDIVNFSLFIYTMSWSSNIVKTQPYLAILIYLPVYTIRLNMNVFYGGMLFFNVLYKQLNKSLCKKKFLQRTAAKTELSNLNFQLEKVAMLYFELAEAIKTFHSVFSFQFTLWITTQLITLTIQYFYQYVALVQLIVTNQFCSIGENVAFLGASAMSMYELFTTAYACNSLVREFKKTTVIVHELNSNLDLKLKDVDLFSIRLLLNKLTITECGMFEVDLKMIHAAFSTIFSYLVILVQFELAMREKETGII